MWGLMGDDAWVIGVLVGRGGISIMQCSMLDGGIIDFSMGEWIWGKRVIVIYSLQNNIYHLSKQINLPIL